MQDRKVFIDVIVKCATDHACNGTQAAEALSRSQNYDSSAAQFAILLALIYLDAGPAVQRMLADDSGMTGTFMYMFCDKGAASAVNSWREKPAPDDALIESTPTEITFFALENRAFSALAVLIMDKRFITRLNFEDYSTLCNKVGAELKSISEQQGGGAPVLVACTTDQLLDAQSNLEDGGVRSLRSALNLVSQFKERSIHASRVPTDPALSTPAAQRLQIEIDRDRARVQAAKLQRTEHQIEECLQRITNDAIDLLNAAVLAQKAIGDNNADMDADVDDKIDDTRQFDPSAVLTELESSISTYEESKKREADAKTPEPTVDQLVRSFGSAMRGLRSHAATTRAWIRARSLELQRLEAQCAVEQQAAHNNRLETLRTTLANVDPDDYLG